MDLRQPILLAIATIVPLILLVTNRDRHLLGWVCLSFSIHIFDTAILVNLPTARIAGLLYLPYAVATFSTWISLRPAQWSLAQTAGLIILAILFGFVWPWPDTIGRPFNLTAAGRAIVNTVRVISDLSLTVFVAKELSKPGAVLFSIKALIAGATLTALAGIVSFITLTDFYFEITGLRDLSGSERSRGLSFEPRGLGMACAYGMISALIYPFKSSWKRYALVSMLWIALMVSFSTSAFALIAAGVVTICIISPNHIKLRAVMASLALCALLLVMKETFADAFEYGSFVVSQRLDPAERVGSSVAANLAEEIAFHLDGFDASALLFLNANPEYLVFGVGPGMMLIPASDYLPPGIFSAVYGSVGLDGLPTHGPLLEVANGGVFGLILWVMQVLACFAGLRVVIARRESPLSTEWEIARILFVVGVVFYVIQVSLITPIWSFMLGIGWAASSISARSSENGRNPDPGKMSDRQAWGSVP